MDQHEKATTSTADSGAASTVKSSTKQRQEKREQTASTGAERTGAEPQQQAESSTTSSSTATASQSPNGTEKKEQEEEEKLYFSPDKGNVVFTSAMDSWGFQVADFARIWAKKTGMNEALLNKTLWGDFYLDAKDKKIRPNAYEKGKTPLFVKMVLESIWSAYRTVLLDNDVDKAAAMAESLGVRLTARELRHKDPRIRLQSLMGQWLPLASSVLSAMCERMPGPGQMVVERLNYLLSIQHGSEAASKGESLVRQSIKNCDGGASATVVFVSKMVAVDARRLSVSRAVPQTAVDKCPPPAAGEKQVRFAPSPLAADRVLTYDQDRPIVVPPVAEKDIVFLGFARVFAGVIRVGQELFVLPANYRPSPMGDGGSPTENLFQAKNSSQWLSNLPNSDDHQHHQHDCRRFSPSLPVIRTSYSSKSDLPKVTVGQLYLYMGRELEEVTWVPAGNVVGIAGLDEQVLKTATLTSTELCPSLAPLLVYAQPILRVSIETGRPAQMPELVKGLRLLNQADPSVQTYVQETGEHVLVTAGEVHLERCITDLNERFCPNVDSLTVSEPIVPFLETIINHPKTDRLNENIQEQYGGSCSKSASVKQLWNQLTEVKTVNGHCRFRMLAAPMPSELCELILANEPIVAEIEQRYSAAKYHVSPLSSMGVESSTSEMDAASLAGTVSSMAGTSSDLIATTRAMHNFEEELAKFRRTLLKQFEKIWMANRHDQSTFWGHQTLEETLKLADQIWAFGSRRARANLLINRIDNYHSRPSIWEKVAHSTSKLRDFDHNVVTGFQLRCVRGPLCEEPLRGVVLLLTDWSLESSSDAPPTPAGESGTVGGGAAEGSVFSSASSLCSASAGVTAQSSVSLSSVYSYSLLGGQIISAVKEGVLLAVKQQPVRLMAAMYSCTIQASADVLGKVYALVNKRAGRIVSEEIREGTNLFHISATLPVIESLGFCEQIRTKTSGLASPQLTFSHWEVVDMDPFWVPTTEEELLHFGKKADNENKALRYMNAVRRRKGLAVEEHVVEYAEKQRTLSKTK